MRYSPTGSCFVHSKAWITAQHSVVKLEAGSSKLPKEDKLAVSEKKE